MPDSVFAAQAWPLAAKLSGTFATQLGDARRAASIKQAKRFVAAGQLHWQAEELALWPQEFRGWRVACSALTGIPATSFAGNAIMAMLGAEDRYMVLLATYPTNIHGQPPAVHDLWFKWRRILAAAAAVDAQAGLVFFNVQRYLDPSTQTTAQQAWARAQGDGLWLHHVSLYVRAGDPLPPPVH